MNMTFSKRMKTAREKKGMTLQELGKRIGRTEATVQRYESGNIKNLKSDVIEQIAFHLEVNPAYLMGWIDKPEIDTDDHSNDIIAAHIDEDVSDEEMDEIINFIDYIKSKRE